LELLIADTLARSVLLIPAGVLIYYVVKYAKYEKIQLTQQIVNYVVLALISISLWLLLGYAIDYLLAGGELTQKLVNILPFYIFTGFMFYLILILFFENKIILSKSAENIEKNINKSENNTRENHTQSAPNTEILERIAVKSGQKIHVVSVSDILYLQAFGDYIHIFTIDGKYLKEQTMKYFENNLPLQFVRVHRSYIVNVESISRIELYERQNHLLTLKNGHQIKISITGYKLLKQKLNL
jgi:ABC-type multidrug transport system fused ATPase/permease subunit